MSEQNVRPPEDGFQISREEPEDTKQVEGDSGFLERLEVVWGQIDHEELVRFAQALVRIPSVFRPDEPEGNEARAARYIADYLDGKGFEVWMEEVAPGRPNCSGPP